MKIPGPTDYASSSELSNSNGGIYDVTDNVTDDQFEQAIDAAREERNLSRANVVRKVKGGTPSADPHALFERPAGGEARSLTITQIVAVVAS